ncbi:hypothetical protein Hanom_Chr13g01189301 [Helianthus anomalus]
MDFLEKRAEFPLFLDAPDSTSYRYFIKIQARFKQYINSFLFVKCQNVNSHYL